MADATAVAVFVPASGIACEAIVEMVINGVSSPLTRRVYATALRCFLSWWEAQGRPPLNRLAVQAYKAEIEANGAKPAKVNQHLAVLRRLAKESAANGYIAWETATGIVEIPGAKERGIRTGNWLTREQAQALIGKPDGVRVQGKRDRAVLGLLVGCGLRRSEIASLTVAHVAQREGRSVIVDLRGKHGRIRSIAVPRWVKALLDDWTSAADLTAGRLIRSIDRYGNVGKSISAQAILDIVVGYSRAVGVEVRPHDLRRTCARLCRSAGGDLEQIQMLLGHSSVLTTERYLGTKQDLQHAPNDGIDIRI